ncbi:MAG TPA: hypothetical protein VHW23_48125 [Kofleriaceae bacterium]|jgi:hypothetical protein|nr:hypothetical protein [Kofleriaceae bacterium]
MHRISSLVIAAVALAAGCEPAPPPALSTTMSQLAGSDRLNPGEQLLPNQAISSGSTALVYQGDNNLVLYQNGTALWATMAALGAPPSRFAMQGDCNAVVYATSGFSWASWTNGLGTACYAKVIDGDWFICNGGTRVFSARGGGSCTTTWYFPEGGETVNGPTADYYDFQTYYHFANPNPTAMTVAAYFQSGGRSLNTSLVLPASSRTSLTYRQLAVGMPVDFAGAEFTSATPGLEFSVSTTMFNNSFEGHTWEASKAVNGANEPHTQWAFGEGGIYSEVTPGVPAFDHIYAIYNPNPGPSTVSITFYPDEFDNSRTAPITFSVGQVAGHSRLTFNPFGWSPTLRAESSIVSCAPACVAQMTMYERNIGRHPNTQSALGSQLARTWYVVNIPTGASWEPRIYLFNPSPVTNPITLVYHDGAGTELLRTTYPLDPWRRISYDLTQWRDPRLTLARAPASYDGGNISLEIDAEQPIALTKILYWAAEGPNVAWNEGASTTAHSQGGHKIVFPGGNTGGGFNNYIQVLNAGTVATNVWVTTYRDSGLPTVARHRVGTLNPSGMMQFDASTYINPAGNFSTVVETDYQPGQALVGESANYFDYTGPTDLWRSGDAVEAIVYNGATPIAP